MTWTTWFVRTFIIACCDSCQALAVEQDELQERVRLTTLLTIGKTIVLNFENAMPESVMLPGGMRCQAAFRTSRANSRQVSVSSDKVPQ
jgi:hypothetical protein